MTFQIQEREGRASGSGGVKGTSGGSGVVNGTYKTIKIDRDARVVTGGDAQLPKTIVEKAPLHAHAAKQHRVCNSTIPKVKHVYMNIRMQVYVRL